jgi:hypothetical protein
MLSNTGGDDANNSITHPAARLLLGKANAPLTPKSMSVLFRMNEGRGREVQGRVDEAQCWREEKEGGGIGSRGRGGVLGAGDDDGWGPNDCAVDAPPSAFERGVRSRPPSPSTTMTMTQQSNSTRGREGEGRWYGDGWRRRVTMVMVAMAPGLCWDNELGGKSLVSAIVLPAIDHDNNDLLNQQSTNNGVKRRRWWLRRRGGRWW